MNSDNKSFSIDYDSFKFGQFSPISKFWTTTFGIYLTIIFLLCIILNSTLLLIFIRNKELRIPFNMLIMAITSINLLSTIQFPFLIHSSFSQKYIFKFYFNFLKN
jgi:hypothetical protein